MRIKRDYQSWVANETLEDYALRYAASSYRKWSPALLANTALGGISFLALEAIGASITLSFGFHNAFPAILVVCALIFLVSVPIAFYSSEANVDIDLLTRGAGFGYVGSTITSLIYASFTFIFFALEAAILAQALELAVGMNIVIGYLLSSLLIIPLVFFGVTLINQLQRWTQPLWAVLLVAPFVFVLVQDPGVLHRWAAFPGVNAASNGAGIDLLLFGSAAGVLFSLMGQIGEQVDYLRFLPDRTAKNRLSWWSAMLAAGPGWIVVGGLKLLAGSLLAVLALQDGVSPVDAVVPVHLYVTAYRHVFDSPALALAVAVVFVVISQVKINVTNAYAGSLAWSNVFARLTHYHPGRVVWLVFNVMIALLLTLLGIFKTLETVLSVYSNLVIAWLGALVADLVVLKPLGISPRRIEFKRAHLYQVNPVGCGSMLIASVVSTCAFAGLFGDVARAYSAFIALLLAFASAIVIAYATGGRYYIARADVRYADVPRIELVRCCICERDYEAADMAWCPFNQGSICSLCCGLDTHCRDRCKHPAAGVAPTLAVDAPGPGTLAPHFGRRIGRFFGLFVIAATATGAVFLLSFRLIDIAGEIARAQIEGVLLHTYAATLPLLAFGAWWIVLSQESRELAQADLLQSLHNLEATRKHLVESEKMASLGGLVAGVAHEINTPVGIVVSAASYLRDRTESVGASLARQELTADALDAFLRDAGQSTRLMLSNADRAARLVQSFKQIAVDQVSEARRHFDLGDYIRETVVSLEPKMRGTRVSLRVECPAGIVMDSFPGPLAQVLTNLIVNSLTHAFAPGETGHIVISARRRYDEIVIEHEDDGCGIPDALHERIFEPFFTTRRGAGGSGLGLHLAYALVARALGGTLEVRNAAPRGAVFVLTLPRVVRAPDGAAPSLTGDAP
ncbi:ATP-binding protein [Caballeronia sp. LZ034LL]|uniref:ATP-binding protein n=1 Tax=Caballeronia sp. LZ034LL TaxID=3038567 RepID=UPI002858209C|nr:ATP-binding protein [Caballeronia sp. LZ034LL]MDR5833907.1 ATP-binding protein [Caballeronia sp. LZ034LL]